MKPHPILHPLALCASLAFTLNARAGDGSWTATAATGNWNDPLNWQGGNVADASGATATFGSDISAATTVTLDSARSIGNLAFSDNGGAGSPWTVTHASNKLTLAGGAPTITATTDVTISATVDGTAGLVKGGAGTLALTTKTNTYTGGTTVDNGILTGSIGVAFNGTQAGSFGTGNITVNGGATLKATGFFVIGGGQNTTRVLNIAGGTVNLQSAGTGGEYLRTINMTGGAINFDSGTIYFRAPNGGISLNSLAAAQSSTISTQIDLTLGSFVVDTAIGTVPDGRDLVLSGTITQNTGAGSGAKTLTKNGTGTLVLSGTCNYTGTTAVNAGTLLVNGTLNTAAGSAVNVAANATLGGTGTINRTVNLAADSTLAPGGPAIGTLTTGGAVTMQGKTRCQINKTVDALTQDLFAGSGTLTYGGTLEVTATGDTLVAGDSFKLFDAAGYSGGFSGYTMPALPVGLSWDLSNLVVDGSVSVVNFVGTPVFSPISGGYMGSPPVTLNSDAGATIYYTLNGSTPTIASPVYSGPITVPANSANFTIKAFAKKAGYSDSPIATAVYQTIDNPTWITNGSAFWSSQPGDEVNWQNTVVAGGSGVHANFSTLALTADSTVTLDGSRSIGQMVFGDASATPASNWLLDAINGSALTLADSGTPSITVNNQTTTISAPLAGSQGFTKSGAGTLRLSGAGGYTGDTTVNAGTLLLDSSSSASNTPQMATGKIINNSVVRFYRSATGFTHINASLSGAGDYFVDGPGGGTLYDNRVAFRGTASDNTGTIYLINGGRLWLDSIGANAIGDSAIVDVGPTASFHIYNNNSETIGGLQGSGEVWGQDSFWSNTATLVLGGGNRSANFIGALKETTNKLAITKTGTGTQVLAGTNTYTGATSVEGGTLGGSGATGSNFTVKSGGTLAPGDGIGTMHTKALGFESGATFKVEINCSTATADKLVAHGAVTLAGATASFAELGTGPIAPGTKLVILDYTGQTLGGTFAGLAEGASITIGANSFTLHYADDSKVTLTEGTASGFNAWATANAPGQTMEMDHDHDGVPNGIEYFMGLSGGAFTANPAMNASRLISWPKGASYSGSYGTDYLVQTSTDLSTWTDVPLAGVVIDSDSIDYTVPAGEVKKFARLKVTGP